MKNLLPILLVLLICTACVHSVDDRLVRVSELADCNNVNSGVFIINNLKFDKNIQIITNIIPE